MFTRVYILCTTLGSLRFYILRGRYTGENNCENTSNRKNTENVREIEVFTTKTDSRETEP